MIKWDIDWVKYPVLVKIFDAVVGGDNPETPAIRPEHMELQALLEEAYRKGQNEAHRPDICPACGGSGDNDPTGAQGFDPRCLVCKGTGKRMPKEDNSIDFKIDWNLYPKLAGVFENRPGVNLYWVELRTLLRVARAEAYLRGQDEERKAVVAYLREASSSKAKAVKGEETPETFIGAVVNFGAKLLGRLGDGVADAFESGQHREAEPEPSRDPLSVTRSTDRQGGTEGVYADDLISQQRELDARTRGLAREIVEAQDLKTLEEAKQFAENWIGTAAQQLRNADYWETCSNEFKRMSEFWRQGFLRACCGCVAKDCTRHGAYDPEDTTQLLAARDEDRESTRR